MSNPYLTQPVLQNQQNPLQKYVQHLESKIDYAKWKQNLVLEYNYLPLSNIKEKLQSNQQVYVKKMKEEEQKILVKVENDEIMGLLKNMRDFQQRLLKNAEESERKIKEQKLKVATLKEQVKLKKSRLKILMGENMNMSKSRDKGIETWREGQNGKVSRSTMSHSNSVYTIGMKNGNYFNEKHQRVYSKFDSYEQNIFGNEKNLKKLYSDCLKLLTDLYCKQNTAKSNLKNLENRHYTSLPIQQIYENKHIQWQQFRTLKNEDFYQIVLNNKNAKKWLQTITITR